uniref:Uncharacterized protein n=1 Tax=Anguilla anguilla TaxID=7936 RepID=A0A0E9P6C5_ANGAN
MPHHCRGTSDSNNNDKTPKRKENLV